MTACVECGRGPWQFATLGEPCSGSAIQEHTQQGEVVQAGCDKPSKWIMMCPQTASVRNLFKACSTSTAQAGTAVLALDLISRYEAGPAACTRSTSNAHSSTQAAEKHRHCTSRQSGDTVHSAFQALVSHVQAVRLQPTPHSSTHSSPTGIRMAQQAPVWLNDHTVACHSHMCASTMHQPP